MLRCAARLPDPAEQVCSAPFAQDRAVHEHCLDSLCHSRSDKVARYVRVRKSVKRGNIVALNDRRDAWHAGYTPCTRTPIHPQRTAWKTDDSHQRGRDECLHSTVVSNTPGETWCRVPTPSLRFSHRIGPVHVQDRVTPGTLKAVSHRLLSLNHEIRMKPSMRSSSVVPWYGSLRSDPGSQFRLRRF